MSYFSDLALAEPLLRALAEKGYTDPTPIQRQAIPPLIEGRDLLGLAQTGTGKTAAFALPSLHRLALSTKTRRPSSCRMLVLSPTRELAAQIADNMKFYAKHLPLTVQCIFGGVPAPKQARALVGGTDVLVATPGRLLDLIDQRALTLRDVEIFVLDEADQMMDLGFIHALKRVARLLPQGRQSLFFSATMPQDIEQLGRQFIDNPVKVEVTPQSTTVERVQQTAIFVNQSEKQALLTLKLREGIASGEIDRTLVFSRTKHGADRIVRFLTPAGVEAAAIHGDKSQGQRTAALKGFRDGKVKVLIATDIAARGIDVTGVSHVFNFDIPNVAEQYVHRIGRTGRAGADGIAVSFVADDEKPYLKAIERLTGVKLTMKPLPENFLVESARLPAPAKRANGQPERVDRPAGGDRRREAANARGDGRARGDRGRSVGAGSRTPGGLNRDGQRSTGQREHDRARGERRQGETRAPAATGPRFDPLRDATGDGGRGQNTRGRS